MTVCSPIQYYPGRTRRRRLLDAHGRIAACWSDPDLSSPAQPLGRRSLLGKADLVDDDGGSESLPIDNALDVVAGALSIKLRENIEPIQISFVIEEMPKLLDRIDTILLETPPALDLSPFRGIRFYLCADLAPSQRSSFISWIELQGATLVREFHPGSIDFVIGDDIPQEGSSHIAIRSSLWLMSLERCSDPSALSRGDLRNPGIHAIISVFQELTQNLIGLGQHYVAHAYAQITVAVMQYYEDSASDDGALDDPQFLSSALQGPADLVAAARRLLSRRPPAAILHQLRSNSRLIAITTLTQKPLINVSLARRLLHRHGYLDAEFQFLSQRQNQLFTIEPRCISALDAESMLEHLRRYLPPNCFIVGCGAYRRRCKEIQALPIVISVVTGNLSLNDVEQHLKVKLVISRGHEQSDIIVDGGIRIQIRLVPWAWRHVAVLVATGSDEFVRRLRWRARDLGYLITNDHRVLRLASHMAPTMPVDTLFESERDLFRLVGIDFIAPRWRLAFPLKATHASPSEPIMRPPRLIRRCWRAQRAFICAST